MKSILILLFVLCYACQTNKAKLVETQAQVTNPVEICFAFDQRQCQTDAFAKYLPKDKNSDAFFQGMQSYLADQNIKVQHMRIDMNFHEFTCSACDVCPEAHRFFLSVAQSDKEKIENLNLLNFGLIDCQGQFN